MLVDSDNASANALEVWLAGSTSAGSARVNETMRALGLYDSEMYGGYEIERSFQAPIPIRVDSQPQFGRGKYTTAWDLARLARASISAPAGRDSFRAWASRRPRRATSSGCSPTSATARSSAASWRRRCAVLHKAGWNSTSRHDAGLVFWPGGVYVAAVMTWKPAGVGTSSDVLAGEVAAVAFERFRLVG